MEPVQRFGSTYLFTEDVLEIQADPSLERVHNEYEVAYCVGEEYPTPKRSGGCFHIDLHESVKDRDFRRIKKWTKVGALGTSSSMPTPAKNKEYALKTRGDATVYRVFVQTYNADDEENKKRVLRNLKAMGFDASLKRYRSSKVTDALRKRYKRH